MIENLSSMKLEYFLFSIHDAPRFQASNVFLLDQKLLLKVAKTNNCLISIQMKHFKRVIRRRDP